MPRNQRGIALSEPAPQDQDGRLEIGLRVVPLTGPQADALRQRQLAAIVTLLRRATMRPPGVPPTETTTPALERGISMRYTLSHGEGVDLDAR